MFDSIKEFGAFSEDEESKKANANRWYKDRIGVMELKLANDREAGMVSHEDERIRALAISALEDLVSYLTSNMGPTPDVTSAFVLSKNWFTKRENVRQENIKVTGEHLTNSFRFLEETFGDKESLTGSQEMVIFLTELSSAYHSLKFVRETGNDAYYEYNKLLLLSDRKSELKEIAESLIF